MAHWREVLVGRREELHHMCAALDAALAGAGRLVLLSGEPGIGKTCTATELAARAEREGAQVIWGRCHEEAGAPPYWPWTQVLRDLIAALDADALREDLGAAAPAIADLIPDLRDRLPGIGPETAGGDPAEARLRLFAAVLRFLIAAARRRPRVIVLDDLHWADAPSIRLLRFIVPELAKGRLLLIGTYREHELSRHHPLSDTLGDLTRSAHASRFQLSGLGTDEIRDLMESTLGGTPAPWLVTSIHALTEGNPLFVREVVRCLAQRGLLADAARTRDEAFPASLRIPEGIRDVIGQRLNLLSPACNDILRTASVIGREFSLDVLFQACGGDGRDAVLPAIDDALHAGLVEEVQPDRYRFTHALVRMTLYDELHVGERRRLHGAAGQAIEFVHRHDRATVLPDLARHFHLAQGPQVPRAIDYALQAAAQADASLTFEDAAGFFQLALDLIRQREATDLREEPTVLLHLGEAQRKAGEFHKALATFQSAAALAQSHGFADLLAHAAIGLEACVGRAVSPRADSSRRLLEQAWMALPVEHTACRIAVMGALARRRLYAGAVSEAKALAYEAIAMARGLGDPAVTARSLGIILEFPAEPDETLTRLAQAMEMAETAECAGELELVARALHQCTSHHLELGRMDACGNAFRALCRVNVQLRQPALFLVETGLRATLALLRGDLSEAEKLVLDGLHRRTPATMAMADPLSVLMFALRREQDRLTEVAPVLQAFARQDGAAAWLPGLALL